MNEALIVILAVIWAVILLPGAIRSRRRSPRNTVGGFEHAMDVLNHRRRVPAPGGRELMVPADATRIVTGDRRSSVLRRRRRLFAGLLVTAVLLVLIALVAGGSWWLPAAASLGALASYVTLLRRWKLQQQQAASQVVRLPERRERPAAEPSEELVSVAGGSPHGVPVATRPDEPWPAEASVRIRRWDA